MEIRYWPHHHQGLPLQWDMGEERQTAAQPEKNRLFGQAQSAVSSAWGCGPPPPVSTAKPLSASVSTRFQSAP